MHHRSMQGELRAILQEAADRVPETEEPDPDELITVSSSSQGTWRREDMYNDQAR
jgi:plasmid stability protein